MLEWCFWIVLFAGIYPYAVYPALVVLLGVFMRRRVAAAEEQLPSVTVLTAAYNEAACIEATVRNKLELDYPAALLDIVVVSDGSDDGTDRIVSSIAEREPRVRLIRQSPRQGKTAALNLAMTSIASDIVIFADANSIYRPDAVRRLVRNFADPQVGYVSGKMIYVSADGSVVGDGCTAYMRYENTLRAAESRIGSIVGVDGGIDAVRRRLYQPMRADQLPDFVLPLTVVEQGYRCIYEPEAVLMEESLAESTAEFRMRVRVALRALWALADKRALLNPFKHGMFAWQLGSHKLLRYLAFAPLAAAIGLNVALLQSGLLYRCTFAAMLAVLALAAYAGVRGGGAGRLSRLCYYFVLLNSASALAAARFLRGERMVIWQPRTG